MTSNHGIHTLLEIWGDAHEGLKEAVNGFGEIGTDLLSELITFHRGLHEQLGGTDAINDAVLDAVARLVNRRATSVSTAQLILMRSKCGRSRGVATNVVIGSEVGGDTCTRGPQLSPLEIQDLHQQALDRGDTCKLFIMGCTSFWIYRIFNAIYFDFLHWYRMSIFIH